jgi:SAM-dependent methyltransferase
MISGFAMSKFVVEFGKDSAPPGADGRLDAPAFHRNHGAIWSALSHILGKESGDALELGSGTGQHAAEFARRSPHMTWWPSDIAPAHLASIAAWGERAGLPNLKPPQCIDLADPAWTWRNDAGGPAPLTAMVCNNVLHISPWTVSRNLMAGAGRLLLDGGHLFVYGPFKRGGQHTAPSNAAFDASLRAQNPDWGVRDVGDLEALAKDAGLRLTETIAMPANNLVLVFARAGSGLPGLT